MLRSTLVRNKITTNYLKKYIRTTVRNCLGSQLMQRKPSQVANAQNRRIYKPQWNVQRSYGDLPSHTKVNLPALSPTMETGTVVKWLKKEGDELSEGDPLCEIETDKAVMGFESPDGGFLAKIMIPQGTKGVPIGKLLCIIVQDKAHIAAFKDFKDEGGPALAAAKAPAAAAPAPAPAAAPAPAPAAAPAPVAARPPAPAPAPAPAPVAAPAAAPSGGRVLASPMARKLAAAKQIRLGGKGSGLYGSLKSTDLSGAGAAAPAAAAPAAAAPAAARAPAVARGPAAASGAPYVDIPVTSMRATIAKRLMESKLTIPHYQLAVTVNVEKIMKMRQIINKQLAEEKKKEKLSMNDFIIKAVAGACVRVPAANSHWLETSIRQFNHVDVCVAVATPTGLLTPIIFNCDTRGLIDISNNMKDLAKKAREGKLKPHEFQGGTVTISNLGMFGIQMFNAIVNPPQTLILACGGTQDIVIPDKKKGFRVGKFVTFTSSANHKAIDGAECAMWMKAFKQNLEDPAYMIL